MVPVSDSAHCEPVPVGVNVDPLGLLPGIMNGVIPAGLAVAVEVEAVGIIGTVAIAPTAGDTLTIGTAAAELTPRLPISVDPNGIPV
jgi:hypothetical protein